MRRTHIALVQDPDSHWGFDTVGDYQFNATCSGVRDGVRYWFEFPVVLDPIRVNGKILVPKDQIIMSEGGNLISKLIHNKMWNNYVLVQESGAKDEGRVIRGRYKGRKVLFQAGIGIDFQSDVKYTKDILWVH